MSQSLRVVNPEHQEAYVIRKIIAERTARIESLSVNRDALRATEKWLWNISPEMIHREERLYRIRQRTLEQDRLEAYRLIEGTRKASLKEKILSFFFG